MLDSFFVKINYNCIQISTCQPNSDARTNISKLYVIRYILWWSVGARVVNLDNISFIFTSSLSYWHICILVYVAFQNKKWFVMLCYKWHKHRMLKKCWNLILECYAKLRWKLTKVPFKDRLCTLSQFGLGQVHVHCTAWTIVEENVTTEKLLYTTLTRWFNIGIIIQK